MHTINKENKIFEYLGWKILINSLVFFLLHDEYYNYYRLSVAKWHTSEKFTALLLIKFPNKGKTN